MSLSEEISISFVISDNFSQHLATVIASILANANPDDKFVFHVLAKMLSEENRTRLLQMENARSRLAFHIIDASAFETFPLPIEHVSQEMYYRYLLPNLLVDEQRTIYMDVDILVRDSLKPLWEMDLGDCFAAAISDMKEDTPDFRKHKTQIGMNPDSKYFNSGVILMDLERLRGIDFTSRCMDETAKYIDLLDWPDQDIINHVLEDKILGLPIKWNCMDESLLPKGERPVVEHFANFSAKPWCCLWKNRTWPKYLKFLKQTPYRDRSAAFVWAHILGFFYFRYVKKGIERVLICGILVWRKKLAK